MKNKIKEYRKKNNYSQQKLATIIDISLSQLRNIETGRTETPNIETAIKIKRALNVQDIEELFNIDE